MRRFEAKRVKLDVSTAAKNRDGGARTRLISTVRPRQYCKEIDRHERQHAQRSDYRMNDKAQEERLLHAHLVRRHREGQSKKCVN